MFCPFLSRSVRKNRGESSDDHPAQPNRSTSVSLYRGRDSLAPDKAPAPVSGLECEENGVGSFRGGERSSSTNRKVENVRAARKQVIKMLIWVVLLFLVCWGPRFVMELLLKLRLSVFFNPTTYWVRVALFLLPFVHAVLNPIFYIMLSRNIRVAVITQVAEGIV